MEIIKIILELILITLIYFIGVFCGYDARKKIEKKNEEK
jgi:hypothetical protein